MNERGTPPLALIHGWGMHGEVWGDALSSLEPHHALDLPAHGARDRQDSFGNLASLATDQLARLDAGDQRVVCGGWSLGGLVALQIALDYPGRIAGLVLICSSARFLLDRSDDSPWPGMPVEVFEEFGRGLEADYSGTLDRFAALEMHGSRQSVKHTRKIVERMHRYPPPAASALRSGLHILRETDFRGRLDEIDVPVLLIAGRRDRLVPSAAMRATADLLPDARLVTLEHSAHAPFMVEPELFAQTIVEFRDGL